MELRAADVGHDRLAYHYRITREMSGFIVSDLNQLLGRFSNNALTIVVERWRIPQGDAGPERAEVELQAR